MDIQREVQKIHHQFGVTEKANYEIQKLFDKAIKEAVNEALRIHGVSRSAVEPLIETLFLIATAPHPTNEYEYGSFVETAKRISQKALDDFDKHFC